MDAKKCLFRAVECDNAGRILEAQYLYQEGIRILMKLLEDETNAAKKKAFYERIKEYLERAEQIKRRVTNQLTGGEIELHIPIGDDSTGHSYKSLFGKYLDNSVLEILLEEPYLIERYHFHNLVIFFELLIKQCKNLKYIRIITKTCPNNERDKSNGKQGQSTNFDQLKNDLGNHGVTLGVVYEDSLHDRKITLNTSGRRGYIIKIGRGLHFYKPTNLQFSVGLHDYDFRKCYQTDVDILRTKK